MAVGQKSDPIWNPKWKHGPKPAVQILVVYNDNHTTNNNANENNTTTVLIIVNAWCFSILGPPVERLE